LTSSIFYYIISGLWSRAVL